MCTQCRANLEGVQILLEKARFRLPNSKRRLKLVWSCWTSNKLLFGAQVGIGNQQPLTCRGTQGMSRKRRPSRCGGSGFHIKEGYKIVAHRLKMQCQRGASPGSSAERAPLDALTSTLPIPSLYQKWQEKRLFFLQCPSSPLYLKSLTLFSL